MEALPRSITFQDMSTTRTSETILFEFEYDAAERPGLLGHLEKSLEAVAAVESVEIDHEAKTARVTHHGADFAELQRVFIARQLRARVR